MDTHIPALLRLQEVDLQRIHAEDQINLIPHEITALSKKIQAVQEEKDAKVLKIKQLEVQRSSADKDLQDAENKSIALKSKQLTVKSNEEYQALNHEIDHQQNIISDCEDKELQVLEQLDVAKKQFEREKETFDQRTQELQGQIKLLEQQKLQLVEQLHSLNENVEQLTKEVAPAYLQRYLQVRSQIRKGPYVVLLNDKRCTGCHLVVSGDVQTDVKKHIGPTQCSNCSRILYVE